MTGLKNATDSRYLQAWPRIWTRVSDNKSSKWPEWDSNPGPPDCKSADALTTRPRCLYKKTNLLCKLLDLNSHLAPTLNNLNSVDWTTRIMRIWNMSQLYRNGHLQILTIYEKRVNPRLSRRFNHPSLWLLFKVVSPKKHFTFASLDTLALCITTEYWLSLVLFLASFDLEAVFLYKIR